MYKNNKKIIILGFIISLFFFSIFIFTKDLGQSPPNRQGLLKQALPVLIKTNKAFLEINGEKISTDIIEGENIYNFMTKLKKEGKVNFKDKTYSGMGKLIEEINGIKNGDKYWIYYVNGKKANIGVSNYKINKGDIISWKYEKDY